MTYTSIINAVLRRLREAEVAGPTSSTYATLIGDFVNECKREVEDSHKWTALRQTIQVTTAASTNGYAITGAGKRYKFQDSKRWVYDTTNEWYAKPQQAKWVKLKNLEAVTTGKPSYYYIEGQDASGDPEVYFYSVPDGIYVVNFDLVVPQADLSAGTDELTIDEWPIILGAYAKALAERGDDTGRTHGEAITNYNQAWNDAISLDYALGTDEDAWMVE